MDNNGGEAVAQLADELLQAGMDRQPVGATLIGLRDRDDVLPDHTEAGEEAARARLSDIAARAEALDPTTLGAEDRVTRSVVRHAASAGAASLATRAVEYTVTDSMFAPASELLATLPMISITEAAQADAYLTRLRRLPEVLDAIAQRHRTGLAAGRIPVRRLVDATVAYLDRYLANPEGDPLRRPQLPSDGAFAAERDRLLSDVVRPAWARYREVLASEVLPHARPEERPGLCWLPGGDGIYASLVWTHTTTTDRTPAELHDTGLEIIERLADDYAEIGARVFGTSSVAEIFQRLRTDPAMRWRDADELLAVARSAITRAEQAAPEWFGKLPSQGCMVQPSRTPRRPAPRLRTICPRPWTARGRGSTSPTPTGRRSVTGMAPKRCLP